MHRASTSLGHGKGPNSDMSLSVTTTSSISGSLSSEAVILLLRSSVFSSRAAVKSKIPVVVINKKARVTARPMTQAGSFLFILMERSLSKTRNIDF